MRVKRGTSTLILTTATLVGVITHVLLFVENRSATPVLVSFGLACLLVSFRFAPAGEPAKPIFSCSSISDSAQPRQAVEIREQIFPRPATGFEQPCNAFTIDLEDYFHTEVASRSIPFAEWGSMPPRVEASTHRLLDLLDEHRISSTIFVLGWVARRHPELVREVARRGHEIGCHSYRHRLVFKLTPEEFRQDTLTAKCLLEDVSGCAVEGYRAPSFSITPGTEWAFDELAELGFHYDSSVNPVWHRTYAQPNAPRHPYRHQPSGLVEFPIATCSIGGMHLPIGGGAYMRLLPGWYLRTGLALVNRLERRPATLYMHPWEIDPYPPFIPEQMASRIRQTWGTSGMERKLAQLLASASFGPIREVYASELAHLQPTESYRHMERALAGVS